MFPYKVAGFGILLVAVIALWHTDRKAQYQLGVKDTVIKVNEEIQDAKAQRDAKANSVADAANVAARRVCIDAGIDVKECQF